MTVINGKYFALKTGIEAINFPTHYRKETNEPIKSSLTWVHFLFFINIWVDSVVLS